MSLPCEVPGMESDISEPRTDVRAYFQLRFCLHFRCKAFCAPEACFSTVVYILLTRHIYLKKIRTWNWVCSRPLSWPLPNMPLWTELLLNRTMTWEKGSLWGCRNYGVCSGRHVFRCGSEVHVTCMGDIWLHHSLPTKWHIDRHISFKKWSPFCQESLRVHFSFQWLWTHFGVKCFSLNFNWRWSHCEP